LRFGYEKQSIRGNRYRNGNSFKWKRGILDPGGFARCNNRRILLKITIANSN
jgi:hypothetical protein